MNAKSKAARSNELNLRTTRRQFLRNGMDGCVAAMLVGVPGIAAASKMFRRSEKSVILVDLFGGPSHLDMYDMKPEAPAEIRGEFRPIGTNVPGVRVCEYLPLHAKIADKLAIVNGVECYDRHDVLVYSEAGSGFVARVTEVMLPESGVGPALLEIKSTAQGRIAQWRLGYTWPRAGGRIVDFPRTSRQTAGIRSTDLRSDYQPARERARERCSRCGPRRIWPHTLDQPVRRPQSLVAMRQRAFRRRRLENGADHWRHRAHWRAKRCSQPYQARHTITMIYRHLGARCRGNCARRGTHCGTRLNERSRSPNSFVVKRAGGHCLACRSSGMHRLCASDRGDWMKQAHWGVMTHFLADWRAQVDREPASVEHWNELVDHFDVEGLANQLQSVGAGYYLITIGQNSGYYLSPNPTYDKLTGVTPSKCCAS